MGHLDDLTRDNRQRRNAIAATRAPMLLALDSDGEQVLIDTRAIRTIVPWVQPSGAIGAIIGLHGENGITDVQSILTVDALARALDYYGIVIADAAGMANAR